MSRSVRVAACLWLLSFGLGWAQPTHTQPTQSPSPTDDAQLLEAVEAGLGEEEEEEPPSAKDTDRPAIFGAMIASRFREKAGTPIGRIQRDALVPWGISLVLLPIYLVIARRRGFRVQEHS